MDEIANKLDWKPQSCAASSPYAKKQLGLDIASEKIKAAAWASRRLTLTI